MVLCISHNIPRHPLTHTPATPIRRVFSLGNFRPDFAISNRIVFLPVFVGAFCGDE